MRTDYRIKKAHREAVLNRQRRLALAAVTVIMLTVWFFSAMPFGAVKTEAASVDYIYVTVLDGDSIWSVAKEYRPAGEDLRDFVWQIAVANDAEDYVIHAGQILRIPSQG